MKVFISGSISIKKLPLSAVKKIDNIIDSGKLRMSMLCIMRKVVICTL